MTPNLDWMDMFTLCGGSYVEYMQCQCGEHIWPGDFPKKTLGDLYFAASIHIRNKHEC